MPPRNRRRGWRSRRCCRCSAGSTRRARTRRSHERRSRSSVSAGASPAPKRSPVSSPGPRAGWRTRRARSARATRSSTARTTRRTPRSRPPTSRRSSASSVATKRRPIWPTRSAPRPGRTTWNPRSDGAASAPWSSRSGERMVRPRNWSGRRSRWWSRPSSSACRADVLVDLSSVLADAGRPEEAASSLEDALDRRRRKEDLVGVARAEERLALLTGR